MVFIFKCGILKMVWEIEEENCLWAGDDRDRGNEHPMVCDPEAPSVDVPVLWAARLVTIGKLLLCFCPCFFLEH